MKFIKFFVIQFMLWGVLFLTATYSDRYISKPYTIIDLVTLIISLAIYYIVLTLFDKARKTLKPDRYEFLIYILPVLIAAIVIGALTGDVKF
ncbi:hypothetical protein [Bacillus sp. AFS017336]|uniref:hypothetical protein n=1 Tax=Bacillus sp. AFS017336 TaxID=2033489 RepID=UPI000BEF7EF4|nr:hypothetical protein [Bacillus sp. AFS017336]PEL13566.1 hypothetical protein CN601_03935 [Bacillus sp. AFS017336]